tara:strand:+ start:1321 stop:1908 length:588 start_codon:yes stop_codon:yes gene_type:complete
MTQTAKYLKDKVKKIRGMINSNEMPYPLSQMREVGSHETTSSDQLMLQKSESVSNFFKDVVFQVKQGNIKADFAALQLKQISKIVINATKSIELDAIEALSLEDKRGFIYGDHVLKFKEGSRTVDYSEVPEIQQLEQKLKNTKEKYKTALLGVEHNATLLNEDKTGAIYFVAEGGETLKLPKWKYNKSSLVLTKK